VYPEQMRRLFANLLTGDYDAYAPWVTTPATHTGVPEVGINRSQRSTFSKCV